MKNNMMMRTLLGVVVLTVMVFGASPKSFAQSAQQNQAKAYYFVAQDAQENGQYQDALDALGKAVKLRGKTDARFTALEVKILIGLGNYSDAKTAIDRFYGYKSSNDLQREMAPLLLKIDKNIEAERARAIAARWKATHPDYRDCSNCPEMVVIPSGSFQMGDIQGGGYGDEKPVHRVSISRSFSVGKYEVTFSQWNACVTAGGCSHRPDDRGWGEGSRPVIKVSWHDAKSYVKWLSGKTGKTYRLLSEAEWEYVARAGSNNKYSWGNSIGSNKANCGGCGSQWDESKTSPVGSFRPNGFGVYDMHGNVWEWVEDCYIDNYDNGPSTSRARTGGDCSSRVKRGGSWGNAPWVVRSANRTVGSPAYRSNYVGFRIARTN